MIEKDNSGSSGESDKNSSHKHGERISSKEPPRSPFELTNKLEKKEPSSPQEIAHESVRTAYTLLNEITSEAAKDTLTFKDTTKIQDAINSLADVEISRENSEAVFRLGERLEKDPFNIGTTATEVYFKAGKLGHVRGFEKVQQQLQKEKEEETETANETIYTDYPNYDFTPRLSSIIEQCAADGIPANTWIDTYSLNSDHAHALKLDYFEQAERESNKSSVLFGKRYRDEVTADFLRGTAMTQEFALHTAARIWKAQKTREGKQEVFERFRELSEDPESTITPDSFFSFAETVFTKPQMLDHSDVEWIADITEYYEDALYAATLDPLILSQSTTSIELSIARYFGATPDKLVEQLNKITSYQLNLSISEKTPSSLSYNKELIAKNRQKHLQTLAKQCATEGDFESANVFLTNIFSVDSKAYAIKQCLKEAKTERDVQAITPDDLTMAFDEKFKTIFTIHTTLKEKNPEKIHQLAKSLAGKVTESDFRMKNGLQECLQTTFALDNQKGRETARDVIKILKMRHADSLVKIIAHKQLSYDDKQGLHTLEELAQKETNPIARLSAFTDLAKAATEFTKKQTENS